MSAIYNLVALSFWLLVLVTPVLCAAGVTAKLPHEFTETKLGSNASLFMVLLSLAVGPAIMYVFAPQRFYQIVSLLHL